MTDIFGSLSSRILLATLNGNDSKFSGEETTVLLGDISSPGLAKSSVDYILFRSLLLLLLMDLLKFETYWIKLFMKI